MRCCTKCWFHLDLNLKYVILNALVRAKREEKKLQFGRKNQRSQVRTEKPIRTGVPEVESEARHHYTNLTAFKTGDELWLVTSIPELIYLLADGFTQPIELTKGIFIQWLISGVKPTSYFLLMRMGYTNLQQIIRSSWVGFNFCGTFAARAALWSHLHSQEVWTGLKTLTTSLRGVSYYWASTMTLKRWSQPFWAIWIPLYINENDSLKCAGKTYLFFILTRVEHLQKLFRNVRLCPLFWTSLDQ